MPLIAELKRRNVFKVTGAYLALGWVVTEVSNTVVPMLHLPQSIPATLLWIGLAGLPFVILFAWVYELTPEGLKRESEIDRSLSITHVTGKRLDYIILALLVVAIGLFVLDRILPNDVSLVGAGPARDSGLDVAHPSDRAQGALLQEKAPAPDEYSIAVLPFADMSQEKDQEYLADGMAEELLNLLAQVPELKVIARTSSFSFKGKDLPIAEIARQLNVAHVLEGSVRKAGNTVRITAQLVRAADSVHLWSDTYDRPLDDIFAVQDEIATAIVRLLQIKLTGGELSRRKGGTQNLEAWQLDVKAWNQGWFTRSSADTAEDYLEQAVELDPDFGDAWASLAEVWGARAIQGWVDPATGFERARQLAQHALSLGPDAVYPRIILQNIYRAFDWNWAAAEAEGRRVLAIEPGAYGALTEAGRLYTTLGRWDDAERQLRAAIEREPVWFIPHFFLSAAYYRAARFAEAESMYRRVLELEPRFPWTRPSLGLTLLAQGKVEEALAMVQQEADEGTRLHALPVVLQAAGRQAEADEALQAQIARWADTGAYFIARSHAYRGDHDRAMEWLERAYQQKEPGLTTILGEPLFRNIASDPRFIAFLKKMNLPAEPVPVNWQ